MKKYIFPFIIFCLVVSSVSFAQRGKNGTKTISTTGVVVNAYTTLTADATAGAISITVASNTLGTNFTANLAAGDLVFIIQMQGATVSGGQWWEGYGYIEAYNSAGKYEFAQVLSVSGSNTINLTCGLAQNYTSAGHTQVIRVPRYTNLIIQAGGELTCDTWNGGTGGVVVVETLGNVTNNGTVNATGKGFRGGAASPQYASPPNTSIYADNDINSGGHKGEGIAGYGTTADGPYCRGAAANGGGGGNGHNTGGGGGSNVSFNIWNYNGCGFPDTTTATLYSQCWDLEPAPPLGFSGYPFHKNYSYGGGRGGYGFSWNNMDASMYAPGNSSWGGAYRMIYGGFGGRPLAENEGGYMRLYMGGGGGGGHANDTWGGAGGNGGGIIYVMTYGTSGITGSGTFTANGSVGSNSEGADPTFSSQVTGIDGAGGGGGGGSIVLNTVYNITGSLIAQASGGKGGDQVKKVYFTNMNQEAEGPGGGGGGGYIAIAAGSIARTTDGGANGITGVGSGTLAARNSLDEFPPNGATKGGPGKNNAVITNFTFTITQSPATACQGQPVTLTANFSGTVPPGTSYGWYTSEIGGTALSASTSYTINNPQTTTTYYFGTCPGTYRVPYTLTVIPFQPEAGNNVSICYGSSTQLQASWGGTGGTYSWYPPTWLNNSIVSNPLCTAQSTIEYFCTMTNPSGCTAYDSVLVTVYPAATVVVPSNISVCNGGTVAATSFTGTPSGVSFAWANSNTAIGLGTSGTGNVPSFTATNTGNAPIVATITVTPSANGCSGTPSTYTIIVNPTPTVTVPSNITVCNGGAVATTNFVSTPNGGSFTWTNNNTSIGFGASGTGNIPGFTALNSGSTPVTATITVTPTVNSCNGIPSVYTITVNSTPTVTVPSNITVCNAATVSATNFISIPSGGTFTWVNNNTNIGLGANGTGNVPSFTATNTGSTSITAIITVTPTVNLCSGTSASYTITVNPTPTVTVPSNITVCNNATVAATNFTSIPSGGTFTWTNNNTGIGLGASGTGNIPSFTATNNGSTPITATITVTPSVNNCTGVTSSYTITVNASDNAAFNYSPSAFCQSSADPIANITGGSTGTFSATPAGLVFLNTSTGLIDLSASGINTYTITFTTNGICPSSSTETITITTAPSAIISYSGTYCQNEPDPYPTFGPGAGAGTFSAVPTGLVFINTGTGQVDLSASSAGTYIVTNDIAASGACLAACDTAIITIYAIPTANVPSDFSVCNNESVAATNFTSNPAGATFSWTNSNTAIGLGAGGTGNAPSFTAINLSTSPITATITVTPSNNNCTGNSSTYTITVNPTPTADVPADITVCNTNTVAATSFSSVPAGGSFTWTNNNPSIGIGAGGSGNIPSFSAINTGTAPVVATITVTPSVANCSGIPSTYTITVNPSPVVNVPANISLCNGIAVAGTPLTSPTSGATFTWTNSNPSIGLAASGTGDIPPFTAINAGSNPVTAIVSITATANNCTGTVSTYTITVNPTPSVTVPVSTTVCNGTSIPASNFTSGTGGTTFAWTNNTTSIGLAASGSGNVPAFTAINTGSSPVSAVITVTPSANNCAGTPSSYAITVNPTDNPAFNYSTSTYCQLSTDPVANITGGATGTFTASPAGLVFLNSTTGLIDLSASAVNTYTITFTTNGNCPSTATVSITITPAPSAEIIYAGPYCQNAPNPLPVFGTGASAGSFSAFPAGLVFVSTTTGQVNLAASTPGAYIVTNSIAASGSCPAVSDTAYIIINTVPIALVPASINVCNNGTVPPSNFSSTPDGSTFAWTNSNTSIGLSSGGTGNVPGFTAINTGTTPVTATISVIPSLNNCNGSSSTYTITVNPTPTVVVPSSFSVCSGDEIPAETFTSPVSGCTFTWTNSNTAIGLAASGTGTIPLFTATNSGATPIVATIIVTPSANGCSGTPSSYTITVKPAPTVTPVNDTTFCNGTAIAAITLTSSTPGVAFTWTNSNSSIGLAASGTGNIPGFTATNTTSDPIIATISVTASANGCAGIPTNFTITVNPSPEVTVPSDADICNGAVVSGFTFSSATSGTTFTWTNSNTSIGLPAGGTGNIPAFTAYNTGNAAITAVITVTPNANGCQGAPSSFNITVEPTATVTVPGNSTVCSGTTVSGFTLTGPVAGATFSWTNSNPAIGLAAGGSGNLPTFNAINGSSSAIVATITVTPSAGSCAGTPSSYTITVNPAPGIDADSTFPGCPGMNNGTITITVSGGTLPYAYSWNTGETTPQLTSLTNGTYTVTVTDGNGCATTYSVLFDVIGDCVDPVVYVPNIFSPNGDGNNDVFYVRATMIRKFHLLIYDRWGEKLFESDDIASGWDGTYKGQDMHSDVYVYHLALTLSDNTEVKRKGNISLVR